MTKDVQSALRQTMEVYTKVARFCLFCNYDSILDVYFAKIMIMSFVPNERLLTKIKERSLEHYIPRHVRNSELEV